MEACQHLVEQSIGGSCIHRWIDLIAVDPVRCSRSTGGVCLGSNCKNEVLLQYRFH